MYYETKTGALSIRELPLPERPREKILSGGVSSLSNAELLAVLIGNGASLVAMLLITNPLVAGQGSMGVNISIYISMGINLLCQIVTLAICAKKWFD
mgnify:CR=1 FL=1